MEIGEPRRTVTVEPIKDPVPRELPEAPPEQEPAEAPREPEKVPAQGSGPTGAPDYAEPIVGWRGWFVIPCSGGLRLCSPIYRTVWLPRHETIAFCHGHGHWWRPPPHPAPQADCRCGLYASTSIKTAARFVQGRGSLREAVGVVIGQVSLWGSVVECERGWRAECAYPARLYLPLGQHGRLSFLFRPTADAEQLALALRAYGVPLELVACASVRELARVLEHERGEA